MKGTKQNKQKLNEYQQSLVTDNIGLAYSRALIMKNNYSSYKLSLDKDDFTSYALEGLCKAALKYDSNKNIKFSTFAVSYIDNYIKSNVYLENPTIRMPSYSLNEDRRKQYRYAALNNSMVVDNFIGCTTYEGEELTTDCFYYCGEKEISFQNIEDSMYIESMKKYLTSDEVELLSYLIDGELSLIDISQKLKVHLNTICRRKKKLSKKIKDYMSSIK